MSKERILIVDDEKNIVSSLIGILSDEGYKVTATGDGVEALEIIHAHSPDLVLLDIWLPGMDGIEVLKTIKTYYPEIEVLIMSGHGTIDTAVKATRLGARDFVEKPFSMEQITLLIAEVLNNRHSSSTAGKSAYSSKKLPLCFESVLAVKKAVVAFSKNMKPVLLNGENGTGKEFIAQAIHRRSRKSNRSFVKIDCSLRQTWAIHSQLFQRPEQKLKSPGNSRRRGDEKVVYLSNIESLSKGMQEKLAEALQPNDARSADSNSKLIPARIFASSTVSLATSSAEGRFHSALLDVFKDSILFIPPLRDRAAIIPNLVKDYLKEIRRTRKTFVPKIDDDVMVVLCQHTWPGNVKELRCVLNKLVFASSSRKKITVRDVLPEIQRLQDEDESLQEMEPMREKQPDEKTARHFFVPGPGDNNGTRHSQRTLKRSVVLCGSSLHSGTKTGLILQPMPPGTGIVFGSISTGKTVPARLENVQSTDYSTCLQKDRISVGTIEHIMATLHMYRVTNLLIKIGDEAPVMDGSAKDFCDLIEDGGFEDQQGFYEEIVINKKYTFGNQDQGGPYISIEPSDNFRVSYHMEYPEPIGVQDYTYEFTGNESFKKEIAPARTFGFMGEVAQLAKMGYASGGKLDNFILLGDKKVLNTELRFKDEFPRHKILDILGDFYLLGKPIRGYIKACRSGHTQNIGLLQNIRDNLAHKD